MSEVKKKKSDPRVEGIVTVGWVTLAMLGISIPLTAIIGGWLGGAIPLAIILGSGLMAVRIWSSGERLVNDKLNQKLQERIEDLEERLASLEMIDSVEAHFAARHREGGVASPSKVESTTMGPAPEQPSV